MAARARRHRGRGRAPAAPLGLVAAQGQARPGRVWEQAALREVDEEIGFRCRLGRELPSTSYTDQKGRSKVVRYWLMEPEEGEFTPNAEVDELRWLIPSAAAELLSYPHDRELVKDLG